MANYDVTLEVTPTPSADVQIETDPGSGVSASNAEAWAVGKRHGVDVPDTDITYHNNSKYYAQQASGAEQAAQDAEAAKQAAQAAVAHYPYVDTTTGNWMCWDTTTSAWVNTGVHAQGPTGTVPDLTVGTVTTLAPGSSATVTRRSGSPDEAPVFDFGIPKGDTGSVTNVYGSTIAMSDTDSTKVKAAIDGKTDKVSSATNNNFAALDASGNLKDSGHKHSDYLTQHQDISGKADKVSSATNNNFAALDANGNLKDSGHKHSDYLTQHQDISGKADKVSGATSGDFAGLDGNGNLTDSGKKASDFKTKQTAVSDPTSSGSTYQFISSIEQDTNGVITPAKKAVRTVTTTASGLMSAADKVALDGVQDALAIVVSGDTAPANIASGAYIFLKGHSTLASGGYHATAAISSGDTISSSNVAEDADGIANALNSKIDAENITSTCSWASNIYANYVIDLKAIKCVAIGFYVNKSAILDNATIVTLPSRYTLYETFQTSVACDTNGLATIDTKGALFYAYSNVVVIRNPNYPSARVYCSMIVPYV